MQVRVLGCSGGIGAGLKTTCLQVGERILIDAGTGLELLDVDAMCRIRHLFLTHAHLDHIACLPLMLPMRLDASCEPLTVHASQAVIDALQAHLFNWTIWPDYQQIPSADAAVLRFEPLEDGEVRHVDGATLTALVVNHPTPTQGYLLRAGSEALAFSGDSGSSPRFWQRLSTEKQLKHVLVDVSFPDAMSAIAHASGHYTPAELAGDLSNWESDKRPQLHISHLKPGFDKPVMAQCYAQLTGWNVRRLRSGDLIELA